MTVATTIATALQSIVFPLRPVNIIVHSCSGGKGDCWRFVARDAFVGQPVGLLRAAALRGREAGFGSCGEPKGWGGQWELNPRHPEPQSGALPIELCPP